MDNEKGERRYRSISLPTGLYREVEAIVEELGTYTTITDFVKEAVREKIERIRTAYGRAISRKELIDADSDAEVFE